MPVMDGTELKRRREACGYSQGELAERLGVHSMTVSKWERDALVIPIYVDLALQTLEREKLASKRKRK